MICNNCKKNYTEPLELRNGEWACPNCKELLGATFGKFVITEENDELYNLSEGYYFRYLTSTDGAVGKNAPEKLLDKAISLCKEAVALSHPLAVVRLAYYYDKDYIDLSSTEFRRAKTAAHYYKAVCLEETQPKVETKDLSFDWHAQKLRAARLLLEMLAQIEQTEELKNYGMDFKSNYLELKSKFGEELGISLELRLKETVTAESQRTLNLLKSCLSKTRAPLFGVVRLKGRELKKLFTLEEERAVKLCLKLDIGLAKTDKDNKIDYDGITIVRNESHVKSKIAEFTDGETALLYFFNGTGGKKLSFTELRAVKKTVKNEGRDVEPYELVRMLANSVGRKDYVFYDDDVLFFKKKRVKTADALRSLIIHTIEE